MRLKTVLHSQSGFSLPMVIVVVAVGIGSISYLITDVLPKLQSEKKKAETTINYRIFMASINDYILHGIRERWCLNVDNGIETDLLISNNCGSSTPMEDIVTYPGNLERILWVADNIGSVPTSAEAAKKDNRILALNYNRLNATPAKTSRSLKYEDIYPQGGKLNFTLTRKKMADMTDQHPLYIMSKNVRDCVDSVEIELFQVKDSSNIQSGEERKIGIKIKSNISRTKFSCYGVRTASSTSYYTFYPRRLHTYSLLKYGNLKGSLNNEYHGPVYVAGDFILPAEDSDKDKNSVFYNTLTLGVYNEGKGENSIYRAGRIVKSDKTNYTFTERGHPYLSKQDNYPGFKGFLGGIHLDASEDKGFYNLFNYSNTSSADVSSLEACIEEAKFQTTPSLNAKTILAYTNYSNSGSNASVKLSFSERNRFKPGAEPSAYAGKDQNNPGQKNKKGGENNKSSTNEFSFAVTKIGENLKSMGDLLIYPADGSDFDLSKKNHYLGTIGPGSAAELSINYEAFDLETEKVDQFLGQLENANKGNFEEVIDQFHVLNNLPERNEFVAKARDLKNKCDSMTSEQCFFFGYSEANCGPVLGDLIKFKCDYSDEVKDYKNSQANFKTKLEEVKKLLESDKDEDGPTLSFSIADLLQDNKLILNQKAMSLSFTPAWKFFYPIVKPKIPDMVFRFNAYNYSTNVMGLIVKLIGDTGTQLEFKSQSGNNDDKKLYSDSWRRAYNNTLVEPAPKPIFELDCPQGMGLADWDLDMSGSASFAWNYANTPGGAQVDSSDHEILPEITFTKELLEGHQSSTTKSVVEKCIVPADRTHVYGFYVCKELVIQTRKNPLYMIGTFIVHTLTQSDSGVPVQWHSIWDTKAADFILSDLNKDNVTCKLPGGNLIDKTFVDLMSDPQIEARLNACSAQDLVNNGPNNFSWTTVDPDIGIAQAGDTMTSQKVNRIQKWVIKEESRAEFIR